jgi:prevent-host-death family protein
MKKALAKVTTWQLQTAKNRFSEVVEQARTQGPQIVTRHGAEAVVVLGIDDYHRLIGKKAPVRSFVACLLAAPKTPGGLVVERSRDAGRNVEFE